MKAKSKIKDYILAGTAVFSLFLNAFLIYWQNFHSYADAKASILMPPMREGNNDISIDIVFLNTGNQYIVIERAMIMAGGITKKDNSKKKYLFSIIKVFDASFEEGSVFPKIMKPGEMYLAKLRASYDLQNFINKVINVDSEYYPNTALVKLEIRTMNNQGETFTVLRTCSIMSQGNTEGAHLSAKDDLINKPNLINLLTNFKVCQPKLRDEVQPLLVP